MNPVRASWILDYCGRCHRDARHRHRKKCEKLITIFLLHHPLTLCVAGAFCNVSAFWLGLFKPAMMILASIAARELIASRKSTILRTSMKRIFLLVWYHLHGHFLKSLKLQKAITRNNDICLVYYITFIKNKPWKIFQHYKLGLFCPNLHIYFKFHFNCDRYNSQNNYICIANHDRFDRYYIISSVVEWNKKKIFQELWHKRYYNSLSWYYENMLLL